MKQTPVEFLIESYFMNDIGSISDIKLKECVEKARNMEGLLIDDFSVKLLIWMANLKEDSLDKEIDFTQSDEKIATELQQYFKTQYYGKE